MEVKIFTIQSKWQQLTFHSGIAITVGLVACWQLVGELGCKVLVRLDTFVLCFYIWGIIANTRDLPEMSQRKNLSQRFFAWFKFYFHWNIFGFLNVWKYLQQFLWQILCWMWSDFRAQLHFIVNFEKKIGVFRFY